LDTTTPASSSFVQHGVCGADPQSIPTTDPPWPSPNSGIAIAWAADHAPSGNFVPVYFFGCYLYGSYYGSAVIPLAEDPAQDFIGTASCDVPPVTYPAYAWGSFGLNEEGQAVCYEEPEPEACCFELDCVLLDPEECVELDGIPMPGILSCDPNPCLPGPGACCIGPDCYQLLEAECIELGGDFLGYGIPCEPNPCPDPLGACCYDCICELLTEADCLALDGVWFNLPSCEPNPCPPCYACWSRSISVKRWGGSMPTSKPAIPTPAPS